MAPTYELIASNTLTTSAASVTFSSIPATYTDLILRVSIRTAETANDSTILINYNGVSGTYTGYTGRVLYGNGSSAISINNIEQFTPGNAYYFHNAASSTSNVFSNGEVYIPSYTVAQNKPISMAGMAENNATSSRLAVGAGLWSNTTAITSIALTVSGGSNFAPGSSFFLYGIKNS